MLAQAVGATELTVILAYLLLCAYLGWLGYRRTKTAADYLLAGRRTHPFIMALSYGATLVSTSAIVGFGGVAGMFGMSLLWLTFFNIFVGIFVAFIILGERTRKMGHRLDAHTFPELLGRRYQSNAVQVFAGMIIFVFMPLYTAAVLIGGTEFMSAQFKMPYDVALLVFSAIVACYVVAGGLKAVMYTDAFQGAIMFVGMATLLAWTYGSLGGVTRAHADLTAMAGVPSLFKDIGHDGWTSMPRFGWGKEEYNLWWIVVSTLVLGVGIGVLAQPQLVVRFMTVKSKRELNRAVAVGGIFILFMTGVAFTVGALSNVYFYKHEKLVGKLVGEPEEAKVIAKKERDLEARIPCKLIHLDTNGDGASDVDLVKEGIGKPFDSLMPRPEIHPLPDGRVEILPRATAITRALIWTGTDWMFNTDSIIPAYVGSALPAWFGTLFLLTLLAAAMSTLSSQLHTLGAGIGRDVYGTLSGTQAKSLGLTRLGIMIGLAMAVLISHYARGGYIIARATAIFFGLCASAFLPSFVGGLFFRGVTRAGAKASLFVGFLVTGLWILFIKDQEARALGICKALLGKHSLLEGQPNWPVVDPMMVALPLSIVTLVAVSLFTRRPDEAHITRCIGTDR